MKRLFAAVAATALLAVAGAASAHDEAGAGYGQDSQYNYGYDPQEEAWNNGGDTFDEFQQEYDHITQGIQHGLSDGSYTRSQAFRYYRSLQNIRRAVSYNEQNGNYDSGWAQDRLERLHETMHRDHIRGHERLDRYGYGDQYGYGGHYR